MARYLEPSNGLVAMTRQVCVYCFNGFFNQAFKSFQFGLTKKKFSFLEIADLFVVC